MNLVSAQCPACNAQLEIPAGLDRAFCLYCGSQVIAVGGTAQPAEFQIEAGVLVKYRGNETHVVVPGSVREIGKGAFAGAYIDSVVLPEGLMAIGDEAFSGSTVSQANLPSSLVRVGIEAFRGTRIAEAEIPAGATLCARAFRDCAQLDHVTLPSGLDVIRDFCFAECKSLKSIEIPASVKGIYSRAFENCSSLSKVTFEPDSRLREIGYGAFRGCALTDIDIPASVEKIDNYAFLGCALANVELPAGVKEVGAGAFFDNPIKEFNYPAIRGAAPMALAVNGDVERIAFHPDCDLPHKEYGETGALFVNLPKLREVELNGVLGERVSFYDCPSLEKVSGMDPKLHGFRGTSQQSPLFQRLKRENDERVARAREEKERREELIEAQHEEERRANSRRYGKCQHCGGSFKGLVVKTCVMCGKKKDY